MIKLLSLLTFFSIVFSSTGQLDQFLWAQQHGGRYISNIDIAQQSNGNLLRSGWFGGRVDFDPSPAEQADTAKSLFFDGYLQILDSNGNLMRKLTFPGTDSSAMMVVNNVEIDSDDNIYLAGFIWAGPYDMDPGAAVQIIDADSSTVSCLAKYDPNGNYLWHRNFENIVDTASRNQGLKLSLSDSSLILCGSFIGQVNFSPGSSQFLKSTNGQRQGYITEFDLDGNLKKLFVAESSTSSDFISVKHDKNGNICILGEYTDSLDFDLGSGVDMYYSADTTALCIIQLDSNFNYKWGHSVYGNLSLNSVRNQSAFVKNHSWFLTFRFEDTIYLQNGPSVSQFVNYGGNDHIILGIDSAGQIIYDGQIGGRGYVYCGIQEISDSTLLVFGSYQDSVDFDPGVNTHFLHAQNRHGFTSVIDHNGNHLETKTLISDFSANVNSVIVNPTRIYLNGNFRGTMDADMGPWQYTLTYDNSNYFDIFASDGFLIKNASCNPFVYAENITSCSPYTWRDGNTYDFSTNEVKVVYQTVTGCDSIYKLNFTYAPNLALDSINSCQPYTWIDGNTYSEDTIVHYQTQAISGCDSIVTLKYIKKYNYGVDIIESCQSTFTWRDGNTYSAPNNTAKFQFSNPNECDSIIHLVLLYTPSENTDTIVSCQNSYTWINGVTYFTNNNTATHTLQNSQGCDSVVTLNLTFTAGPTGTDKIEACQSYTWIDGNTYTSNNNTATHTLTSSQGCDSVVTLNLTIGYPESSTDIIQACNKFTWIDGNTYTSDNNTATYTLQTQYGCDSVVTLDLTIDTVNIGLFRANQTLTAEQSFAGYQWYDCNSGENILGATQQYYNVSDSGSYACIVTYDGCTDTTECFDFASLGLDAIAGIDFKIYPNPNAGKFTVDFGQQVESASLKIWSMDGKLVKTIEVTSQSKTEIEYQAAPGLYWLEIDSEMGSRRVRISRI